jgi:prevent-host-death family protein
MPRTISASEAKTQFGAIMDWTAETRDDVIIESHGQPKAVIISFEAYQDVLHLREEARRQSALQRLRALRDQVRARNPDVDEAQADTLASRFSQEMVVEMVSEGKVHYQTR